MKTLRRIRPDVLVVLFSIAVIALAAADSQIIHIGSRGVVQEAFSNPAYSQLVAGFSVSEPI